MPFYNEDLDLPASVPSAADELGAAVDSVDALLMVQHAPLMSMSTERSCTVSREAVTQYIMALIGQDAEIPDLTVDSSLQSQGLDSLKVMSLVFKIEEHYCIVLDEEDADDLRTVGDLAALVVRRIGEES